MESAHIAGTDPPEIVTAHELRLWSEARVEATRFECTQCTAELTPVSFRPHNVRQPHFRTLRDIEHDPACSLAKSGRNDAGHQEQHRTEPNKGGLRRLTRFPVKLVDTSETSVAAGATTPGPSRASGQHASNQSARNRRSRLQSRRPASSRSLRAFADAHWQMTIDERMKAPIELPGINADNYHFAFRGLPPDGIEELKFARVFYADIRYTAELHETDSIFTVELFAGEYDPSKRRYKRPWTIVVDHSEWTERQRSDFRTEFKAATREGRRTKSAPRGYALAQQDPDSPEVLHVSRRHLITVLTHRP